MKRHLCFIALLLVVGTMASCSKDESPATPSPAPTPQPYWGDAYIIDSSYLADQHMKVYNFAYSSFDPFGRDIMLSGTITLGDEVSRQAPARGLLLRSEERRVGKEC